MSRPCGAHLMLTLWPRHRAAWPLNVELPCAALHMVVIVVFSFLYSPHLPLRLWFYLFFCFDSKYVWDGMLSRLFLVHMLHLASLNVFLNYWPQQFFKIVVLRQLLLLLPLIFRVRHANTDTNAWPTHFKCAGAYLKATSHLSIVTNRFLTSSVGCLSHTTIKAESRVHFGCTTWTYIDLWL